ncbi:hypothetical protein TNCV_1338251 [Trichonephila clavipes]|nr:hypothetical protein TNCV_1338251 [Trichonephila clavipes]
MIDLPPEVDKLTDEEGFDDTETLSLSEETLQVELKLMYLMKTMMIEQRKIIKQKVRSCSKSVSNTRKKGKRINSRLEKVPPNYNFSNDSNASKINYEKAESNFRGSTPVEVYEEFLSPTYLEHILTETEKYAKQWRNKLDFSLTNEELKHLSIFLFSLDIIHYQVNVTIGQMKSI